MQKMNTGKWGGTFCSLPPLQTCRAGHNLALNFVNVLFTWLITFAVFVRGHHARRKQNQAFHRICKVLLSLPGKIWGCLEPLEIRPLKLHCCWTHHYWFGAQQEGSTNKVSVTKNNTRNALPSLAGKVVQPHQLLLIGENFQRTDSSMS